MFAGTLIAIVVLAAVGTILIVSNLPIESPRWSWTRYWIGMALLLTASVTAPFLVLTY